MRKQKLVLITGAPSIGKTSVGEALLRRCRNAAFLDGDWLWHVNPFSLGDKRLRNGDRSMSFALDTYLSSDFETVIFSSVILSDGEIRKAIIKDIASNGYDLYCFHLKARRETLRERHRKLGDGTEPAYEWLGRETLERDIVIDTDGKDPVTIAAEIAERTERPLRSGGSACIKLFTDDLVLRTVTMSDLNQVMLKMKINKGAIGEEEAIDEIEWMRRNHERLHTREWKHVCLAVIRYEDREIIGWCGLDNRDASHDSPALYYLIEEKSWNRGFGTQAAMAMIDFGFNEMELPKIHAGVDKTNIGSIRILEKIGMEYRGVDGEGGYHYELER